MLGYAFAGGQYTLDPTPVSENNANTIKIENAVFDEFYGNSTALEYSETIPIVWDFDTLFHAYFNNNLLAGNISFAVSEINKLRLKRRVKGSSNWVTIYEQTVNTADDLAVEYYDITARANTTYEYTIVPVFDQVEGSLYTNEITTDFQGLFIVDRDNVFATELDVVISEKRNKPRSVITTINRKYPYVISNGSNNYDSGNVSAQWLEYNSNDDSWDIEQARNYVHTLKDFLNNGSPKLIKYQDGRMWLIEVSSPEIIDTEDDAHLQVHTSFDWVEIGDCDKGSDLYINGLINTDWE